MDAKTAAEVSGELDRGDLMKYVREAYKYMLNGRETVKHEIDYAATKDAIREKAGSGYREWVRDLFGGAEEKHGIRNNKNMFTASGNRRSFDALHYELTLENVVRAMREEEQKGGGTLFGGQSIWGAATKDYGSIGEIKADSGRLGTVSEDEYKAIREKYAGRLAEITAEIADARAYNKFTAIDDAAEILVDVLRKKKTVAAIDRELRTYSQLNIQSDTAQKAYDLFRDISNMPTGYFEAKPQRAVGFDEAAAVIVPQSTDGALTDELRSAGVRVETYADGDEAARLDTLNRVADEERDVRFSKAIDREYMDAVQSGDVDKAREMVREAAKDAGYTRLFFHGSKKGGGFTVFRDWQYFTENREYAKRYANRENPGSLYETYVKMENPFDTRIPEVRELFEQARQEYGMGELQENGLPDWTDGYDIADYIDENDLPYDGIILDEGGDMVNGKPVSRGLSYVIRNSSQVKSADIITYDDDGNVIPLSERFNSEKDDIRYSKALDKEADSFTYDALIAKPDMRIASMEIPDSYRSADGVPARSDVVKAALASVRAKNNPKNTDTQAYVRNLDTGNDILVNKDSVTHGLYRKYERNAVAYANIGDLAENAILINRHASRDGGAEGNVYLSAGRVDGDMYLCRIITNENNTVENLEVMYALNAKKEPVAHYRLGVADEQLSNTDSTISIADFLDTVKRYYADVLPKDVLEKMNMARPGGELASSMRYSKSAASREAEIARLKERIAEDKDFLRRQTEKPDMPDAHKVTLSPAQVQRLSDKVRKSWDIAKSEEGKVKRLTISCARRDGITIPSARRWIPLRGSCSTA